MINSTLRLYKSAYAGLSKRIWLLSIVMLINRCGTMVLAFMTLYCVSLGFSMMQGGWVVALYGTGSVAGAFIGGKLSDRFGFYYMQLAALFFGGLLFMVLGQMRTYNSICIFSLILGMVNESFRPANASAIAHYSTAKNRTQSFSLVRLSINIGFGIGMGIGGVLASINYHLLFWADGITSIFAAFMLLLILPKVSVTQQIKTAHNEGGLQQTTSPYKDRTFLYFLCFTLIFATCFFQIFTTVPIFFKQELMLDEFWIGVILAGNGLLIAVFEMIIVFKLEGKRPYLKLMFYGSLLMGMSYLLLDLPFISGFIVATLFMIIITIAEIIGMPFMNSYYISRSNGPNRGQYAGLYTMAWSAAQVIGSSSGTFLAYNLGFNKFWYIIAALSVTGAAGYHWLYNRSNGTKSIFNRRLISK